MKKFFFNYLFLLGVLVVAIIAEFAAIGQKPLQLGIGIILGFAYIGWGVYYHHLRHELHPRIVIEYVLIAAIALVLLLTVLF